MDTRTQLCAVIGNPVAHSLSPELHNAAFAAAGVNAVYLAFRVEDLAGCIQGMRALEGFRGMSVTIPHKIAIMPFLDEIAPLARRIGCVNTVINNSGHLVGTSTDGLGVLRAFDRAGVALGGKRVLFVGTGGAARAAAFALVESAGLESIRILGRTPENMHSLVNDLQATASLPIRGGSLRDDLSEALQVCDIILQSTPIGMHGHAEGESCVPAHLLRSDHIVFDMVYRPMKTRLILDAEARGCTTILGLEMLLQQAMLQFEAWMNLPAPESVMRQALTAALARAHF